MFGDSNGQIKLRAKEKFKFLSTTTSQQIEERENRLCVFSFVPDVSLWQLYGVAI